MQGLIAGLMLGERTQLGKAFEGAIVLRKTGKVLTHMTALVGSCPDCVFMLGSYKETATFSRNDLLARFQPLSTAAMAQFGRKRCLMIFDRDGKSYDGGYGELTGDASPEDITNGERLFGHLNVL